MNFVIAHWKWIFSGVAFVGFVVVQQVLYSALVKACKEIKDAIDQNTTDHTASTGGFVWLQDVMAVFTRKDGGWVENAPLPREAVIDTLDHEIGRNSCYSAMQRWGNAAPLIGVILSALGFMVSPPELTGEVSDIMSKLGPLFVGVFVGAMMALVNQMYLHYAEIKLGSVRAKAVGWFDEIIWKAICQNTHNVLGQAASETQNAAKQLETSSQQLATCNITYRDSLLELNRQLAVVREAAGSTSTSFDEFAKMMNNMTGQLSSAIQNLNGLNSTVAAIENGSVVWNVAAAKLNNASTAIETSSKKFHDEMAVSTSGLMSIVSGLSDPMKKLEGSIEKMTTNTDKHTELATAMTATIAQSDRFLVERLALNVDEADLQREMASRTRAAIDSLQKLAETASIVNNTGSSLNLAAGGLRDASATIGGAVKGLFDSCNGFSARCAAMQNEVSGSVTEATTGLKNAARELAQPVQLLSSSVARVSKGSQDHSDLSERLENLTKLGERLLQDKSQSNAVDAQRMDSVEKRLEDTAKILTESAISMRDLQHGLDGLVQELRLARENKDARGGGWFPWRSSSPRMKDGVVKADGRDVN